MELKEQCAYESDDNYDFMDVLEEIDRLTVINKNYEKEIIIYKI